MLHTARIFQSEHLAVLHLHVARQAPRASPARWPGQHARLQLALLPLLIHPAAEPDAGPDRPRSAAGAAGGGAAGARSAGPYPAPPQTLTSPAARGAYCAAAAALGSGLAREWACADTALAAARALGALADAGSGPRALDPDPAQAWRAAAAPGVRAALQQHWPLWLRAAAWHPHAAAEAVLALLPLLVRAPARTAGAALAAASPAQARAWQLDTHMRASCLEPASVKVDPHVHGQAAITGPYGRTSPVCALRTQQLRARRHGTAQRRRHERTWHGTGCSERPMLGFKHFAATAAACTAAARRGAQVSRATLAPLLGRLLDLPALLLALQAAAPPLPAFPFRAAAADGAAGPGAKPAGGAHSAGAAAAAASGLQVIAQRL